MGARCVVDAAGVWGVGEVWWCHDVIDSRCSMVSNSGVVLFVCQFINLAKTETLITGCLILL